MKKKVLVVDDNQDSRALVALFLRDAGFDVREASTGGEALRMALGHPELIVLDVRLPDLDGYEVCRRLKGDPATASIPVLHLSAAYRGSEERARGLASGADAYLTHPVEPVELAVTVRTLLRASAAEAEVLTLFRRAPEAMIVIDGAGACVDANDAASVLVDVPRQEIPGWRMTGAFGPAGSPSGTAVPLQPGTRGTCELRRERAVARGGAPRPVRYSVKATLASGRALVALTGVGGQERKRRGSRAATRLARLARTLSASLATVRGIGERRQADDVRWQLASIVESSDDAIIGKTLDGIIFSWNAGAEKMYGYRAEEIKGQSASVLSAPERRDDIREILDTVRRGERLVQYETVLVTRDGRRIDVSLTASPLTDERGKVWGASTITRDISERKRAEAQLRRSEEESRALSVRVQRVREEERTRIAREIHDELGQVLTGLKMDLAALAKTTARRQPVVRRRIVPMLKTVDHTIELVRRIASELRPGVLDVLGVAAAIEWQAREFEMRAGIPCRVTSRLDEQPLDPERSTAIFRIFQESLTNVARHASATKVSVRLWESDGRVMLRVQDDGKGITEAEASGVRSLGLLGMRERAALLGGDVRVSGAPGRGTTVTVAIPRAAPPDGGRKA